MKVIGVFEAKTHLPQLLEQVAKGEQFTITKHGTPVALLLPVSPLKSRTLKDVIDKVKMLHSELGITGLSAREARETGRKY
ncbi:MAG TPA: type II toxin-antitoxin system prevent-host-death family antitoxin [Candidatus Obscuribacterales bacterium]